ncbi:hypothetical protein Nepgr_018228 [Nepenthes gracilis]|uniref:Protein LNK1 n=1 Tax=Nepenthes gracilis TaxID=150966 RepID=A0AAD3SSK2_NEPGR|nr:hypothetical protein Nepgr_018228 [Nepenthes gracilis]
MSDLCMYELEDIVWDEFDESDDHIVPHPAEEHNDECVVESYIHKRTRHEVTGVASNADTIAHKKICQKEEETSLLSLKGKKEIMLEKGSWSHLCDGDLNKRASSSASDDNSNLSQCLKSSHMEPIGTELCEDDCVLGDQGAAMDNGFYSLGNVNPTEDDLNFYNIDQQDKVNNDLLYYGWPDIENFEDVDRMFRSCDSTFGLGIDDAEFGWVSSSHAVEGSDDKLKSGFKISGLEANGYSSVTEHHEGQNNTAPLVNDSDKKFTTSSWNLSSLNLDAGGSAAGTHTTFSNVAETVSQVDNGQQINQRESKTKRRKPSEGKRKTRHLENYDSFLPNDNKKQSGVLRHPFGNSKNQSSSLGTPQQRQRLHHNGLQAEICFANSNFGHQSNQVSASRDLFGNKSEDTSHPSKSRMDSLYTSNHMQSAESSHDISFQTPAVAGDKKKGPCHHHKLSSHPEKFMVQTEYYDSVSLQKQANNFEGEVEGHSEVTGSGTGIQSELDSSYVQESCMSSGLDEISLEASSFHQFLHVMEQLDIRTKLCIRDSLYRLAKSAEQRHKCANGNRDDKDASGAFMSDETNEFTGFMDMETNTNPIDRSIAHLLFHRPSDSSAVPAFDVSPVTSRVKVIDSRSGHLLKVEIGVSQEETAPAAPAAATVVTTGTSGKTLHQLKANEKFS